MLLTNLVVGVPSTQDTKLVPYSNILGFFHVRSVEQYNVKTYLATHLPI